MMASITINFVLFLRLIVARRAFRNALIVRWRKDVHGVREKTMMRQIPILYSSEIQLFVKCIKPVFVLIIIIGISFIANWNWKSRVKDVK